MGGDDGCKNNILNILNATELEEAWLGQQILHYVYFTI